MSTLAEIQRAIEMLPTTQMEELAAWLDGKRVQQPAWPVPPPDIPREELEQVEAEIEAAFPSKRY